MTARTNYFKCKARDQSGYCKMWLRECVGGENCNQGNCAYCIHAAISPKIKESICTKCTGFDFKKGNYTE